MYGFVTFLQLLVGLTYGGDLREVDDADLLLEPVEFAPGENGFDALREPSNAEEYDERRFEFDEQQDHIVSLLEARARGDVPPDSLRVTVCCPEVVFVNPLAVRRELDVRSENLSQLEAVLDARGFIVRQRDAGAVYPEIGRVHAVTSTTQAEAALLAVEGEPERAVERALDLVRFGLRVERGRGGLLAYLSGLSVRWIGAHTLQRVLVANTRRGEPLETELLRHISDSCRRSADTSGDVPSVIRSFYAWDRRESCERDPIARGLSVVFAISGLDDPVARRIVEWCPPQAIHRAHQLATHVAYQPRRSLAYLADAYRALIARLDRAPPNSRAVESREELRASIPPPPGRWTNVLGERLAADTLGYTLRAVTSQRRSVDRSLCATLVTAALLGHVGEHGAMPASLDALVPAWLDEVPIDPRDGEPFEFHAVDGVWELHCDPLPTEETADDACCDDEGPPPWRLWPVEMSP